VPTPINFLNSDDDELGPTVTANQSLMIFTSNRIDNADYKLYVSRQSGGTWSDPATIPELDIADIEYDGDFAADGLELHYISGGDPNGLRRVERAQLTDPWLVPPTPGIANCEGPSLFAGELGMVVSTESGIAEYERGMVGDPWTFVRGHDELTGHAWPGISQDGLEIFATDGGRLYRATRTSLTDEFGPPQRVLFGDSIDQQSMADPELSHDGKTMYLVIQTSNGFDVHVTTRP
jgi:hypothetical protein